LYSATNYHDLVDMPFFVGQFDVDSAQISGTWVRFATYPSASVGAGARVAVWEALKRVIPVEVKVFGEVPWTTYSVMQITDPADGARGCVVIDMGASARRNRVHLLSEGIARWIADRHHGPRCQRQSQLARRCDEDSVQQCLQVRTRLYFGRVVVDRDQGGQRE